MNRQENTKKLISDHYAKYPLMETEDLFKLLHQSTFGCEHAVKDEETAFKRIEAELGGDNSPLTEELDGNYSRVGLSYTKQGLNTKTLARLFYLSAEEAKGTVNELEERINAAASLIKSGALPLNEERFCKKWEEWKNEGYRALHHSESFRTAYNPSYRVIANKFLPYLPLFARIDAMLSKGKVRLAVEGGSASGKTTLSAMISQIYDCTILHTDDYFLRPEQRTAERLQETGGNFDRERFLEEIITPLNDDKTIVYSPFKCSTQSIMPPISVSPKALTVVEGVYSTHPELGDWYNLSVFLDTAPDVQKTRVLKRNGDILAKRFFEEWIPMENRYFTQFGVVGKCDMLITSESENAN